MNEVKKLLFPGAVTLIGIAVLIAAFRTEQNLLVIFGVLALILTGAIGVVMSLTNLGKPIRMGLVAVLVLASIGLAYADYASIQGPIEFNKKKEKRYKHVIQRLKDIREAELAFKSKYQRYTGNMDSLVDFVKNDSLLVILAIGERPDTMTTEAALEAGLISRDTSKVAVLDSLFKPTQEDRAHPFHADSLPFVPFTGKAKFILEAGTIERSSVDVPVFMAKDSKPFDPKDVKQVGSMTDPKTNGNWE